MSTELMVRPETEPVSMDLFQTLRTQAAELVKTGFLPAHIKTAEQAVAIALIGRELGIPMMLALRKVYVIQGTPALAAELMLSLAQRTGELKDLRIEDDGQTCTVTVQRKGRQTPHTTTFSMQDAETMGLIGKDNWRKQPKVMRQWRAVGANLRVTFPDATGGLYPLEELAPDAAVDERGELIGPLPTGPAATENPFMPRKVGVAPMAVMEPPATSRPLPVAEEDEALRAMLGIHVAPAEDGSPEAVSAGIDAADTSAVPGTVPAGAPPPGTRTFDLNGRSVTTAGATKEQMLKIFKLRDQLDALTRKGAAKDLLGRECGCEHATELTEQGAARYLAELAKRVNRALAERQRRR